MASCGACKARIKRTKRCANEAFGRTFTVGFCDACGMAQILEPKTRMRKIINDYYAKDYWEDYNTSRYAYKIRKAISTLGQFEFTGAKSHYEWITPHLKKGARVLDVGSGTGSFVIYANRKGLHCDGLEPDPNYVASINARITGGKVYKGFLESWKPKQQYDCITMFHVLEHVLDVDTMLKAVTRVLKPGGILYIEVPNCTVPEHLAQSIREHPHTYHFTPAAIEKIYARHGLRIEHVAMRGLKPAYDLNKFDLAMYVRSGLYLIRWTLWREEATYASTQGSLLRIIARKPRKGKR